MNYPYTRQQPRRIMQRRPLIALAAASLSGLGWRSGFAQSYPERAIRVVVPFPAGGSTDTVTRAVMHTLSQSMGQPIVIDNKPGAGGLLGMADVARARPDGYTLCISGVAIELLRLTSDHPATLEIPHLYVVAPMASSPVALVAGNAIPGKTAGEVFDWARSHPETPLTYGTPGVATPHHRAGLLLAANQGVNLVHVPYNGTTQVLQDVAGGHVALGIVGLTASLQLAQSGRLRVLGVFAAQRSPIAPDVPTLAEGGLVPFDATFWFAIYAPSGLPKPIMERLRTEVATALRDPDLRDTLRKGGFEPMLMSPAEHERASREFYDRWAAVIRKYNIRSGD